jgi:hypothetical protein
VEKFKREADKWFEGIAVAERALAAIGLPTPTLFLLRSQVDAQPDRST